MFFIMALAMVWEDDWPHDIADKAELGMVGRKSQTHLNSSVDEGSSVGISDYSRKRLNGC